MLSPFVGDSVTIISVPNHDNDFVGRTGKIYANRTDYTDLYTVKINYGKLVTFHWSQLFKIVL